MIQNNWFVITGAPCSGKTTLLQLLEKKGYKVYFEWARIYIDQKIKKGETLSQIRSNEVVFQKKILKLKINFEKKLAKDQLLFMERGIPDSTAYLNLCKVKKDKFLERALKNCYYRTVFLLELLDYELDYARTESQEEAKLIEDLLEKSYQNINTHVIKVPRMNIDKRLNFILRHI